MASGPWEGPLAAGASLALSPVTPLSFVLLLLQTPFLSLFFLTRISLILWGHKSSDLEPKNALTEGKGCEMGDSIKTLFSSDFIWSRGGSIGAAIDLGLSWRGDAGSHLLILFIPCQTDLKFTLVFLSKGVSSLGKRG